MRKPKEDFLPFAKNLANVLHERKLTLREASEMSGVSKSVIHSWVNGSNPQDLIAVARLAEALHIPFYKLLLGKDDPVDLKNFGGEYPIGPNNMPLTQTELLDVCCTVISTVLQKCTRLKDRVISKDVREIETQLRKNFTGV